MAELGASIENPVNGERIVWIETAASSGGELLAADLHLRSGAAVAARHRHPRQKEHFRVTAGRVVLEIEGERRDLAIGDEATVPAGAAHQWWNSSEGETTVRVEFRPALDTETFFETFFGLARDGKTNSKGVPDLLQIAVAYSELGDSCPQLIKPPASIQRVLFAVLAPIGRMRGRRAVYAPYSPGHPKL